MNDELSALIAASARGDAAATSSLIARLYPRVQSIVHHELERDFRQHHRWIVPLFSTRDIVHDVFAGVVGGLGASHEFADEEALVAYLSTIVRNRLLDAVRHHEADKRDARRKLDGQDTVIESTVPSRDAATPDLAADLAERAEVLRLSLDELNDRHRLLLTLRMMDGATFPEIAAQLGYASAETARQSFLDAQAKLLLKLRARGIS